MRHVNSLRNDTIEMVLTILHTLCKIGGQAQSSPAQQEDAGDSVNAQPMETDVGTSAEAAPADMDTTGAVSSPKAPSDRHPDWHPHVAECIMHTARMLETLLANQTFSRQFVDKGGLQLLLKLYTLKHLPVTFGSSGASHAVLSVFRTCTQLHSMSVTDKVAEALAEHLRTNLLLAMSIGRSTLQDMDPKRREEYTRCVSSLEGITALAAAVSRTTTNMLNEVSKTGRFPGLKTLVLDEPIPKHALAVENVTAASAIIARIGDLERIIHLQIALAEIKRDDLLAESSQEESYKSVQQDEAAQQEEAEQEQALGWIQQPAARVRAHPNPSGRGAVLDAPYQAAIGGMSMHEERDLIAEIAERQRRGLDPMDPDFILNAGRIGPRAASREARDAEDGDIVDPPAASGSPREASGGSSRMRKKSSEDLALEVLIHFTATVRGFYTSLTKSIHTPLRRREEALSMTPAIRSTALHLGLVMKMNCEGVGIKHWDGASSDVAQGAEASSSSGGKLPAAVYKDWTEWKARYLSSIVEDLAAVLFDNRRGTCHCLMLNYWIRCGGLQAFLAQFGTAAQFLWDVMAEKAAEDEVSCLEPLPGRAHRTADEANQVLRAKGLKERRILKVRERAEALLASMLALMNQLADSARILNSPLAASLLTVPLNDEDQETNAAWSNAENLVKSLKSAILDAVLPVWSNPLLASGSPQNTGAVTSILKHCNEAVTSPASRSGARGILSPDPAIVQQVVEMGFSEERVREALRRVGHNSVELAMEWLISHPEEAPMEAAPAPAPPQNDQVPAVAKEMNLAPAQALLKPKNEAPSTEQLVDGAVSVLEQVPSAAFSLADLLKSHSTQQSRREDEALLTRLLQRLHSGDSFAETVRSRPPVSLLGPAHLLALLCDQDPGMRRAAGKTGLPTVALGLLEAWVAAHATRPSALKGMGATEVEPVPRWVDALLLVLDACTHIDWQAPSAEAAASAPQAPGSAAPPAEQGMDVDVPAAAEASGTSAAASASEAQASGQAPEVAGTTGAPAPEPKPTVEDVFRKLPRHEGILSEQDEDRAMKVAMALLRHLHAWGANYQEPAQPLTEKDVLQQPEPSSSAQGVLLLLSCLTKRHSIALKVLAGKGPKLILDMPLACFTPDLEPYISAIMRHILEDPITLQAAMEAEIRSTLSKGRHKPSGYPSGSQQPDGSMPVRQFLQTCAAVINREPTTFFEAVLATCTIRESNGRPLVVLKKAKADGPKASDDKKDGDAPSGGGPPEPSAGGAAGASGASGPSAATPGPQGNPPSSSGGVGSSAAGGSTPGPSGSGPPSRRDSHRRHGGGGGGTPGGPPGGGPGGGGGGGGGGKTPKDKDKGPSKSGKKVPSSFVEVIDTLVDLLLRYEGPCTQTKPKDTTPAAAAMDTDAAAAAAESAAPAAGSAAPAVAGVHEAPRASAAERLNNAADDVDRRTRSDPLPPAKQVLKQEEKDMMVQCIALKMLTDFTLMYNACVGVLLKRDAEGTRGRGSSPPSTPAYPKTDSPAQSLLFRHVMHRHLVYIPEADMSVLGLAEQASFYLMAVCIRSAEGRKRIISEIVRTLTATSDQKAPASFGAPSPGVLAAIPFKQKAGYPPPYKVKAFVELAGSLLSAGAAKSQAGQPTGLSGEMLRCMRTSGVINALIGALKLVDMDHPNAVKSITSILKPLEILTRSLPPFMLGAMPRQAKQLRLFDRARADFGTGAPSSSEPDVERALAALGGPSSGDEPMRDAQDDSAAAGPEAVAAAERLRQAFEREQNGDVEGLARSVESVMEHIIEQAYGDEGMEGYGESDSEEGTDEDVIESEEDDAMGEEPMPDMTDEEDEDLDLDGPEDGDDEHHHRRHHRHHDSADNSVYSDDDDESSSGDSDDEDHEVDVIFDDLEEDAMVGPLLGDDQLIMEHGGDEEGDTEDEDDMHDGGDDGEDHGEYDDADEDDEGDEDEDEDGDGEEFGMDDLPGIEDHEFMMGRNDDAEALMAWPEEDGLIGEDEMYAANPYPPRWVGIPRMNGTHNLARAGAAAQQNAVEMMMNELLNTGALGGLHVDGRDTRFRYRMRTSQPPSGGPSASGAGGAGVPRHRLLQRPATVPGARGTAGEARSANEMRILGMNQPFPAIFGGEDAAGAGEYWMITADPGQRGGFATGPRSIVLQAPNAGSLIDFSAGVLQDPGGNASTSNWSDDGQPPSAMESTQLAGQLEQSLVETLRQHAAPEEAEEPPAALAPAAQPPAAINTPGHAEEASLEQLTRDVAAAGEGELAEQTAALGGTWETQRRGMRAAEDAPEDQRTPTQNVALQEAREALDRSRLQHARLTGRLAAIGERIQQPATTEAPSDAQVEAIRRSVGARVAGLLREGGSETAATRFESFMTEYDPRSPMPVPENLQAMIRDIEDTAREGRNPLAAAGLPENMQPLRRSIEGAMGVTRTMAPVPGGSQAPPRSTEVNFPLPHTPEAVQAMMRSIEDAAREAQPSAEARGTFPLPRTPEDVQAMMRSIEDAARGAQPSAEAGPSRSAAAERRTASTGALLTRAPRPLAELPTPPVSSEAVDRLVQAIRARHGMGQPGGDQTPAPTAAALRSFPPPAPRRTRYQARLRRTGGAPGAEEGDQRQRQLREAMDAFTTSPSSSIPGPSGAIDAALFSSAMSAAMTGITAPRPQPSQPPPASTQPPPASMQPAAPAAPPSIIGADLLSAALSGAQAGPSAGAAQEPGSGLPQHGRDVEMPDAEQHAEESSAQPADAAGGGGAFSDSADLSQRLEGTGIDPEVFLAMPPELQREVLGEEAANEPAAERPQPMDTAQGGQEAAPEGGLSTDAAGPSAQNDSDDEMAGIDPEFLAALPEELQAEVLEAQRRERRQRRAEAEHAAAQAAAARGEGGPQELDLATTLASFPPEVRDEVLMTADEEMLAQLPPAILAEAQACVSHPRSALRERAHGRTGVRHPSFTARRSGGPASAPPEIMTDAALASIRENARRRGELARARLASGGGRSGGYIGGFNRDGVQGTVENHLNQRALATQNMLAFMHPGSMELQVKVDEDALVTLVSLLRVSSQQAKGHLQKLFINLCEDRATMESTLRILLSLLRAPLSTDEAQLSRPRPDQPAAPASLSAALQAGEGSGSVEEAPELLPLVQLGILPRGATAVPPAMTRRVLELLAHLAKHTVRAAPELISLRIRPAEVQAALLIGMQDKKRKGKAPAEGGVDADSKPGLESRVDKKGKGKAPAEAGAGVDADSKPGLDVLLQLLGKTLCKRSSAHLEAALSCIEVTLSVTKRFTALTESTQKDFLKTFEEQAERGIPTPQREAAASGAPTAPHDNTPSDVPQTPAPAVRSGGEEQPTGRPSSESGYEAYFPRPYVSGSLAKRAAETLKSSLKPLLEGVDPELLRRLPRLLGQAGLSDAAYKRAARCIRLVVLCSADHKTPMLNELESELHKLSGEVVKELQKMVDGKAGAGAIVNMGVGALGVRILCICEVISALINPKAAKDQTPLLVGSAADLYKDMEVDPRDVAGLEELISRMEPLWAALSNAIAVLEADLKAQPDAPADAANQNRVLPPGANQVLPLVKAFFVLCEPRTSHLPPPLGMRRRSSTSVSMDLSLAPVTSEAALAPGASPDSKPQEAQLPFLRFAERHRRLVNVLIQQNVQLLLEGPLTQLMRAPRLIDFDNKRLFFRNQVRSSSDRYHGSLRIHVRREHLFEDSFHQLRSKTPEEMRGKLHVVFHGEEGVDAGGVSREWYQVMAREMFNPNISLFVPTGGSTFQPNPNSIVQNDEARGTNHLDFFKFVGRVVGKALYDGQVIDAYFTRSFYKHMLGQPLTYQDIEGVDPEYYKNLTWLLEHDMTDVVDLNFVEEVDYFGRVEHVELKPGGRDVKVTNENKREYVDLVAEHRMTTAIRAQIQAFLKGFWEMVPRDLISMFNDNELELLISGLPDIDVEDLRANTEYHGYSPASPVIQYFWEVVRELDREDLALLVQFVTGTSKVPLDGFKALQGIGGPQKFSIHKAYGGQQKLPAAHTCFNQLDLVEYESKEQLRDRLMIALHEGNAGFGFA
ncbi:g10518 [Coccomyxa elongata]